MSNSQQQVWAESYLDLGYNVIPVRRMDKKPAIRWKEFQERRMTQEEARYLWGRHSDWNIAVVCGSFSGLVVVDADSEEAATFCKLHLDPTPMRVKTSRGIHFYFRHPRVHVTSRAKAHSTLPIDIKGDGGLATGAGSVHESGVVYRLDDGCDMTSIRELPRFIPGWFPEKPKPVWKSMPTSGDIVASEQRVRAYLNRIDGAGSGARSNNTFRVAASVVRDFGLGVEPAIDLMSEWNMKNDPPLDEIELRDIVMSAFKYGKAPIGNKV